MTSMRSGPQARISPPISTAGDVGSEVVTHRMLAGFITSGSAI